MAKGIPQTRLGSQLQKMQRSLQQLSNQSLRRAYGVIEDLDARNKNYVTVRLDNGEMVAGGRFIFLSNDSPSAIARDYGQLRPGLKVEVVYAGESDLSPTAKLIADEEGSEGLLLPNNINKDGMYGIFH